MSDDVSGKKIVSYYKGFQLMAMAEAVKWLVNELDYDLAKGIELDEATGEYAEGAEPYEGLARDLIHVYGNCFLPDHP